MINLIGADGSTVASYSDSFTPLDAISDALERKLLPQWFNYAWPVATGTYGEYAILGFTFGYNKEVEETGFLLRRTA